MMGSIINSRNMGIATMSGNIVPAALQITILAGVDAAAGSTPGGRAVGGKVFGADV